MNIEYIPQMSYLLTGYLSRINHGLLLNEDEAMFYHATLNYLRQVNRTLEYNMRRNLEEEEKQVENDEDNGAGGPAPNPSPPT
jgi:hypothetical protein